MPDRTELARPFDVAVAGGGPAGAATARRLAQAGCRVLLVERGDYSEPRVGESLAPGVRPLLMELGVWDRFQSLGPLPCWGTRSHWGSEEPQEHSHLLSTWGSGWHVDRARFDEMLAHAAREAGVLLRLRTRVEGCAPERDGWRLDLSGPAGGTGARARVVVDATGRRAFVGRRLGARRFLFDALTSVAVHYAVEPGREGGYLMVEARPDGWWYSAPAGQGRLAAVWMTDADLPGGRAVGWPAGWQAKLNEGKATRERVGAARPVWGPRGMSAVSQRLHREAPARWVAVGDAALAVDPISGSGVVRALRMAEEAVAAVRALLEGPAAEPIEAYELARHRECQAFLENRPGYYTLEQRWPGEAFWRRRTRPA